MIISFYFHQNTRFDYLQVNIYSHTDLQVGVIYYYSNHIS